MIRISVGDDMAKQGMVSRSMEGALDVLGTIDPTPFTDTVHAASLAARGRYVDAALTGAGVIPYIGDTAKLAKYAKYAKNAKKVGKMPGVSDVKDGIDAQIGQGLEGLKEQGLTGNGGLMGPMSSISPVGMLLHKPNAWRAMRPATQMLGRQASQNAGMAAGMDQRQLTRGMVPG